MRYDWLHRSAPTDGLPVMPTPPTSPLPHAITRPSRRLPVCLRSRKADLLILCARIGYNPPA